MNRPTKWGSARFSGSHVELTTNRNMQGGSYFKRNEDKRNSEDAVDYAYFEGDRGSLKRAGKEEENRGELPTVPRAADLMY